MNRAPGFYRQGTRRDCPITTDCNAIPDVVALSPGEMAQKNLKDTAYYRDFRVMRNRLAFSIVRRTATQILNLLQSVDIKRKRMKHTSTTHSFTVFLFTGLPWLDVVNV
jgi:hypothetical protein